MSAGLCVCVVCVCVWCVCVFCMFGCGRPHVASAAHRPQTKVQDIKIHRKLGEVLTVQLIPYKARLFSGEFINPAGSPTTSLFTGQVTE